jgi:hypothetical protein
MNKTLFLIFFLCVSMFSASANGRVKTDWGAGWKFNYTIQNIPAAADYDDSAWGTVDIPHTWNATDAQDGGGNYLRSVGWYRKSIPWDASYEGKRIYLELLAASLQAECFVNGASAGTHKGGYNAFRFDITELLTDSNNVIVIKVDNRTTQDIIPLSGDFSVFGGIYRSLFLIVAEPVHVDLNDSGSNGLYLTTSDVSTASAKLEIKARVVNESSQAQTVNLRAVLRHPDTFEAIAEIPNPIFDPEAMKPGGDAIETLEETGITIPAGDSYEFKRQVTVDNPHLWDGKTDPYRYLVDFTVADGNAVIDSVSDYVGFRFFSADNTGFYLNGRHYPLRGVNRHQDWKDKGYAISKQEHDADFGMIYEIGANAVRLAHYPQDPYFHELFDKYGIVVWVEIPFVDKFGSDTAQFMATTRTQLREMIRQRYNRPSILMWGLQNEVSTGSYDAQMSQMIPSLNNLAHAEDPSRLTVQAQAGADRSNWTTDLFAKNQYPGWYQSGTVGSYMDGYRNKHSVNGKYHPVGLSEYGAGGNIDHHEIFTGVPNTAVTTTSQWHPEEYQSKVHEQSIRDIASRNWIWGTFVWNMFDFASDSRNEGAKPGINDKGLVTHDRKVKKDSFYAYKANWSHEPTVYIASRRFIDRETEVTPVTVYSNGESVELFVNGVSQGTKAKTASNCGILTWDNVALPNKGAAGSEAAQNTIVAKTTIDNTEHSDTVVWNQILPDPATQHIALNKPATADATENATNTPDKAVDGNLTTRWAAPNNATATAPHWWEVDLGKNYILNKIAVQWFDSETNHRTYRYTVTAKKSGETAYTSIVNRSNNDQLGLATDVIADETGRYVRINITGTKENNAYNYPSIYEVQIYGWTIESTAYTIDYSAATITVPSSGEQLLQDTFLSNITFSGSGTHRIESDASSIVNGDRLVVTDINGKETPFTIRIVTSGIASVNKPAPVVLSNTGERIHIRLQEGTSAYLQISDMTGKRIVSQRVGESFSYTLPLGVYLIEVDKTWKVKYALQ